MLFGRLIRLCTPDWSRPLTVLEARAISAPQPPRVVRVEGIKPGDPFWYMNGADASCEICGGHGLVSAVVDGQRRKTPCECFDAEKANT